MRLGLAVWTVLLVAQPAVVLGVGLEPSEACARLTRRLEAAEAQLAASPSPRAERRVRRRARAYADRCMRLNQIQVLGTHNSYHVRAKEPLWSTLLAFDYDLISTLEYTHLPLDRQFDEQGIRQIELDVFADPEGGLYADRPIMALFSLPTASGLPELDQPGFKTLHVTDVDFETTCTTFVRCLEVVKAWSDTHRDHLPLAILVEAKDEPAPDPLGLGFVVPPIIGTAELDALDAEIRSVFPSRRLITPDDVRGDAATLRDAVRAAGWPTLKRSRGKVLFLFDNGGRYRDDYLAGHPTLEGRVLFTNATPGDPDAAFVKRNEPLSDTDIASLVALGYVVRTRADADTQQARTGDTTQREAAVASGAQWVSTDYPVPNPDFGTGYFVAIPGGDPARCNPVNAPPGCRAAGIE